MWDAGLKEKDKNENQLDVFCGCRTITGEELFKLVHHTHDRVHVERRERDRADGLVIQDIGATTTHYALCPVVGICSLEEQIFAKGVLGLYAEFVPEQEPEVLTESSDEDEEEGECRGGGRSRQWRRQRKKGGGAKSKSYGSIA